MGATAGAAVGAEPAGVRSAASSSPAPQEAGDDDDEGSLLDGSLPGSPSEPEGLLAIVDLICDPSTANSQRERALEELSIALRPEQLTAESRRAFVQGAIARGIVESAVSLIEHGGADLAVAATNFLADFSFFSDAGTQAVLAVFDRVVIRFRHIFKELAWENLLLLDAAILLCVNVAAACPSSHPRLVPLVRPVCLQIVRSPEVCDRLRGNTILLLANLSMTVSHELRSLGIADALLDLLRENSVSGRGRSVAESVIIFLHGDRKCDEVDQLMARSVIARYCVPIMEHALRGTQFRGMYPYLLYSARLFQVLARSREYAEALVGHERVVPLLLQANHSHERQPLRVESDLEGRRLALEALQSLARFGLWPDGAPGELAHAGFLKADLPRLLADEHAGIRGSAAALWASLHPDSVTRLCLVGRRLEAAGGLPPGLWRLQVLSFLFPSPGWGQPCGGRSRS